jgi:N-acetyl-gamma-glutamyl-phosphate reductase
MITIGLYGATGYTGYQLIRLLRRHPQAQLAFAASSSAAGASLAQSFPGAPHIPLIAPQEAPLDQVEVVFLCLPHGAAAATAVAALQAGARVIDLSADFRLSDPQSYQQWYGQEHPAPQLLPEAIYGLTELARQDLPGARLVANPGCYPTSVLLALQPLLAAGAAAETVIIDAKSGVSGAGRKPSLNTHFVEVADNLKPYKIGRVHRHLPEMEDLLSRWFPAPPQLIFSPHLVPAPRGLLSTIYLKPGPRWDLERAHRVWLESYQDEPFIQVLPPGEHATFHHVVGTNNCALGLAWAGDTLILTSAIDNLLKGAAGQALQNMNAMFGLDETLGLL